MSFDPAAFRARFPLCRDRRYFANQCLGPVPDGWADDLAEYVRTVNLGKRAILIWVDRMFRTAATVERLLGAPPGSVALRDCATGAQGTVAAMVEPRGERRRILISADDFHSSRYVWAAQARRGFEIVDVQARPGEECVDAADLVAAIDERTAVVAVSLASPWKGSLLDVAPVVAAAKAAGALVVLDVYQAVGVVPVDVRALGADVVVGGTHKWLYGGSLGLAFLYVAPERMADWQPVYPGWIGHADVMSFGSHYAPEPSARRFQQGSPAVEPFYTARSGLAAVLEAGVPALRARSLALTERVLVRADHHGLRVRTPPAPEQRGGMVVVDVADGDAIARVLEDQGLDVDSRPRAGVRIGPHPGCTLEECDLLVDAIAAEVERRGARR